MVQQAMGRPRLAKRWNIGGLLLCPYSRCGGNVGRLTINPLQREAIAPLQWPDGFAELRALVEGGHPDDDALPRDVLCRVVVVLPEGFDLKGSIWTRTRRSDLRHRAEEHQRTEQRASPPIRATHGPRPRTGIVERFAWAPTLPTTVRCPECWRDVTMSEQTLVSALDQLADELNRQAAAMPNDLTAVAALLGAQLGRPVRSEADDRYQGIPFVSPSADDVDRVLATVPPHERHRAPQVAEWLRHRFPQLGLLLAARAGYPISRTAFVLLSPVQPVMVPLPDASHVQALDDRARRRAKQQAL